MIVQGSRPGGSLHSEISDRAGSGLDSFNAPDRWSENDADSEASAGIIWVVHVVSTVHVINVDVICVVPACRPRLNKSEPIASVLEAGISADHYRIAHPELMLTPKIGMETLVWNSAAASRTEANCRL